MRAVNAVHESIKQEGQLAITDERDDKKGRVWAWGMCGVQALGIAEREVLHDFGEGLIRHLDDEVYVVRHQAEGMDLMTEALGPFLEQKVEPVPVGIVGNDVLSRITTQNYMVICAWIVDTGVFLPWVNYR
jgi:hypothetical protein